jgi:hypothetical protein
MNQAQRNIVVKTLFVISALLGFWVVVVIPALFLASDVSLDAEAVGEVVFHEAFWIPLVICLASWVLGLYVRAGSAEN